MKIDNTTGFTNTMHRQHWSSNVNGFYTCFCCYKWTNRTTTQWIISHNEFLQRHSTPISNYLKDRLTNWISRITLVSIDLQNYTLVNQWHVLTMVLASKVGMNSMSHVCWNQKTASDSTEMILLSLSTKTLWNTHRHFVSHIAVCTLSGLRTDFLMIE